MCYYFLMEKQKMRSLVIALLLIWPLTACDNAPRQKSILGAWKVDSTYTYYNGFDYVQRTEGSDWATCLYEEEGTMKEIKYGSFQSYFFVFPSRDSLVLRSTSGGDDVGFQVLKLKGDRMVLKKSKSPIFGGDNQERYEIRFFSRTTAPAEEVMPFSDPRK